MKYLSLLYILLLFASCGKEEVVTETQVRPVRYGEVVTDNGTSSQSYTGVATAAGETPLSFRVGGTIRDLRVKLGDRVKRGQVIAVIDPTDLQVQSSQSSAQYESYQAQVKSAETQLVAARSAYDRTLRLYESNSVSLSDFEQARSQFQSAQAQVEAAKSQLSASGAQVRAANNQVGYTRLTAPFSGVITMRDVETNQSVGPGQPVVVLSTEADPEVRVNLPENQIGAIERGKKVAIEFSSLAGRTYTGTVTEVAYAAGSAPSYPVTVRIEKADAAVRPGMAANVRFTFGGDGGKTEEMLITPIASVSSDAEGKFVYLLTPGDGENYVATKKRVTVGDLQGAGFVVTEGLKAGDKVATAGIKVLLDGMEVRLME
jgi:RND family efflux transporter MFP subunit